MASYYGERGQAIPFDIVFIGTIENGSAVAHVPAVPEDKRRRPGEPPRWLIERTRRVEGRIAGRCPWLRQGWDFLAAPEDVELPLVDQLGSFRSELTISTFTTLKRGAAELSERGGGCDLRGVIDRKGT